MLPLATTTVTLRRPTRSEPDEPATYEDLATGVVGHFSSPSGAEQRVGGNEVSIDMVLALDITDTPDLNELDQVEDETTGRTYEIVWAQHRVGLGLDHVTAGVKFTRGRV